MSTVILLTPDQASRVSGPSAAAPDLAALAPVPLTDGRFILGIEVLGDPAHVEHAALLATLGTAELADIASLLPGRPA